MPPISLGLVDDNAQVRENFQRIFSLLDDVEVQFLARDGEEAVNWIERGVHQPQVILMDIEMRKMNGITATAKIKALQPSIKILMMTVMNDEQSLTKALHAGADGYILKDENPLKVLELIKDAVSGRVSFSPEMGKKTLDLFRRSVPDSGKTPADYNLTKREQEVLKWIVAGKTYQQMAELMFVSPLTVRSHMENLYRKLDVHNKAEAIAMATRNGWG